MGYSKPQTVLNPQCGKSCTTPGLHTEFFFFCTTWSFATFVRLSRRSSDDRHKSWKLQVVQRNSVCNPGVACTSHTSSKKCFLCFNCIIISSGMFTTIFLCQYGSVRTRAFIRDKCFCSQPVLQAIETKCFESSWKVFFSLAGLAKATTSNWTN